MIMKTIQVKWSSNEIVTYIYESRIEVSDDFTINSENISKEIKSSIVDKNKFPDAINSCYSEVSESINKETGLLEIPEFEIDSFYEILPDSNEAAKINIEKYIKELNSKIRDLELERNYFIIKANNL